MELENECADKVAGNGFRVHQNPTRQEVASARRDTGDTGKPEKAPDFLIEGHVFDCYAPTAPVPARAVWSAVERKVEAEQTQRVMLNLHDWQGDIAALHKQFDDWPIAGLKELAAVTRSGAIIQIVRKN
ncbi:CdiA C-terminal domain-containing protein [Micromonospora zhanjiangensis]|uniref:tRNA nuclease CdiA C-terminal domain-containing protein n=1 Tax=Micromonospora zhanjiangensis TaxID=1522057 RepID=A0ABV8KVN0_9ACTN